MRRALRWPFSPLPSLEHFGWFSSRTFWFGAASSSSSCVWSLPLVDSFVSFILGFLSSLIRRCRALFCLVVEFLEGEQELLSVYAVTMDNMKQDNEASFAELMKISLEGFSWAENICQRVENICTENNMVQNPGKYVNVVGEHFKNVIHTVVNDLCDHADDVLELFSELTLGHASLFKTSGKKGEELDGDLLHENPTACVCVEEAAFRETSSLEHDSVPKVLGNLRSGSKESSSDGTIFNTAKLDEAFSSTVDSLSENGDSTVIHERSRVEIEKSVSLDNYACVRFEREVHSVEGLSQVKLPSEPQFLNEKEVSTGILAKPPMFAVEGLNCSTGNFSNVIAFDVTGSLSITEANSSMAHNSIATDKLSPFHSIGNGILDLQFQEPSRLLEFNGSEVTRGEHKEKEISVKQENLNIFSREELGNSSTLSLRNEDLNEFVDVKLEDEFEEVKAENDWDDMLKTEIALISSQAAKRNSSKKMLTSRWRPSISRKPASHEADLHSKTSSLDSDWELL